MCSTMHSRTSQFSLKTIQLQNNNSLSIQLENIRRKKNGSYLDLFSKKAVKTYNMTCVSVREKRHCVICIYIFLMVEMFYSFERCFTLFDLPLYSFTSVGVNRSVAGCFPWLSATLAGGFPWLSYSYTSRRFSLIVTQLH